MEGNVTNKEQTSSYAKDFSGTPKQMEHQKAMGRIPAYRYGWRAGTVRLGTKHRPGNQYL